MSKRGAELDLRRHMDAGDEEMEDGSEYEQSHSQQPAEISKREYIIPVVFL